MAWIRKRLGRAKPYEARWRDPDGRERSRSFGRKLEAQQFLAIVEADKLRGSYVDPSAGKVTLQAFGESWLAKQTTDPATVEAVASRLRVLVYPHLGSYELRAIRPSVLQGWPALLQTTLAPGGKTREVPLPEVVAFALAEHLRRHPPVEITLPWRTLDGKPRMAALVFATRERGPLVRRH